MKPAPHLDVHKLMTIGAGTPPELIERLESYFATFAEPPYLAEGASERKVGDHPCLKCGAPLNGGVVGFLIGSEGGFEWGIANGEGRCRKCGWPARAYHRPKDDDGEILFLNLILQYHPDHVVEPEATP